MGKERDGSDDRVDGGEKTGRAPLGRSEMGATVGWTERKPWEIGARWKWRTEGKLCKIAWGELRWEGARRKKCGHRGRMGNRGK